MRLPRSIEPCHNWTDTYGQRQGHFSPEQEQALAAFRQRAAALAAERESSR